MANVVWGICGAGGICNDFALALAHNGSTIAAVAASDLERAQSFATDFGAPRAYGSYEEMANDSEVTAVYVGTVHPKHVEHASLFLRAGKHVLVEKPMGMNEGEVRTLVELARGKNVFLMEAFWTRCFPVVKKVKEVIDRGLLGAPKAVSADCGFIAPADLSHRLWQKSLGGGGMLDMGCYVVMTATMVFGTKEEPTVKACGTLVGEGVDQKGALALSYPSGGMASLSYGLDGTYHEETKIMCENGYIVIEEPAHCPLRARIVYAKSRTDMVTEIVEEALPVYKPNRCGGRKVNYPNSEGLAHEAAEVERCIMAGLKESPCFPLAESLANARIMDAGRADLGVVYDADKLLAAQKAKRSMLSACFSWCR
jgi:dihydrodiol dehydrogenase / D-xylose 1-dehydrogenase (NADP)